MGKHSEALVLALTLSTIPVAHALPIVVSAGGDSTTASIQAVVDQFRLNLGNPNNGAVGTPFTSGRREINWDGGGLTNATPTGSPLTAFQARGATFTTPGTGFTQAPIAAGTGNLSTINATYATEFSAFSPVRVFTPLGSNITDAIFSVPGSNGAQPATVTGFGAVFSDVDVGNSTSIQFFGLGGISLGTFFVPAGAVPDGSLSFLGVSFNAGELITRVRITTGNAALGPTDGDGSGVDVVVMDDFLYTEPQRVPGPSTLLLFGAALAGLR